MLADNIVIYLYSYIKSPYHIPRKEAGRRPVRQSGFPAGIIHERGRIFYVVYAYVH